MYTEVKPLFLFCETPLHAGSGNDLGIVDLPIQRERHTGFPKIEASSLKGSLRERFEQVSTNNADILKTFGPESQTRDEDTYAGAIGFSDARLLLFPVKSMRGVFAWVTCPRILEQFKRDLNIAGITSPDVPIEGTTGSESNLFADSEKVILEEYTFSIRADEKVSIFGKWLNNAFFVKDSSYSYWSKKIKEDIVILSNEDFKDFVDLSTEVITRTKINNKTGTVEDGALFTEEYLPQESLLYSLVLASPVFPGKGDARKKLEDEKFEAIDVMNFFDDTLSKKCKNRLQTGGNATLGKGLIFAQTISNSKNQ